MIRSIYIKDFALIEEAHLQLQSGFTVITGETGAGKSILLGALNMILGERADTDLIRGGAAKAVSEAEIVIGKDDRLQHIMEANGIEFSGSLLLRREIKSSGSRAFINDSPVPIHVLKSVGDLLVDLHGQHDHQLLLKDENHRLLLDDFQDVPKALGQFQKEWSALNEVRRQLQALLRRDKELKEKIQLYDFQFQELSEYQLIEDEEDELRSELKLLDSAEDMQRSATEVLELGAEGEVNILDLLSRMKQALEDMAENEEQFSQFAAEIHSATIAIGEMMTFTEKFQSGLEFNPQRIQSIQKRLNDLKLLQRKYNKTLPELLDYQKWLKEQLEQAEGHDTEIQELERRIQDLTLSAQDAADRLYEAREQAGEHLSRSIERELTSLGIAHPNFEVRQIQVPDPRGILKGKDGQPVSVDEHGTALVSFYISTNKGESVKPLAKIASGGEVSRVMLAIKRTMASDQTLPVMIFDEIDTGISGKVSEKVGSAIRSLSKQCQIIAITHQAQIASQADHHFYVEKSDAETRTTTNIRLLNENQRIQELASLMSGSKVSAHALESARQMMTDARTT